MDPGSFPIVGGTGCVNVPSYLPPPPHLGVGHTWPKYCQYKCSRATWFMGIFYTYMCGGKKRKKYVYCIKETFFRFVFS